MPWSRMIVNPGSILNHPSNVEIYGRESLDAALVESIKTNGVLIPGHCILNEDGKLVALDGHRRKDAAAAAGLSEIEVNVWRGEMPYEEQIIWICEANRQRTKTAEQLYREGDALKRAYAEQARKRQEATQIHNQQKQHESVVPPTVGGAEEKGEAVELAAKKLGVGKNTLKRGINAVHAIDEAKAAGDVERADKIRTTLNTKGAAAAERIARNVPQNPRKVVEAAERFGEIKSHLSSVRKIIDSMAAEGGMKSGIYHKSIVSALVGLDALVSDFRKEYKRVKVA